jgi:hypothetical protein
MIQPIKKFVKNQLQLNFIIKIIFQAKIKVYLVYGIFIKFRRDRIENKIKDEQT